MVPFHAMAELKQTAQAKILMSQILTRKRDHKIVNYAHHQIAHFFVVKTTTIWATPSILTMFHPSFLHFKKLRMIFSDIILSV